MKAFQTASSVGILAVVFALAGCGSTASSGMQSRTPNLDAQFGQAVEMAKAQQTLNPDASKNPDPVKGVDGRAAREAIERYEASFQRPPPQQNIFSIGVSGTSGGGQ
ncbi:hypothetical protein [Azospira restricta]|uniref:Lipoprotein n=1 Tax=Azospira restricta TaxID=404405 RepID=A0A974SMR1_9RHOO|nr:hypothetical protein [Azospira restricta]QRJ62920.1 hypothetical protein IWH25_14310 [Azospira restricta]